MITNHHTLLLVQPALVRRLDTPLPATMPPIPSSSTASGGEGGRSETGRTVQLGFSEPLLDGREEDGGDAHRNVHLDRLGHRSACYDDWDGGQIGGTPSWLNPQHVPSSVPCKLCRGPMTFVLQLYAPIDSLPRTATTKVRAPGEAAEDHENDDNGEDRAFHRTLYVFACPKCCCSQQQHNDEEEDFVKTCAGCVRVLRTQLPRRNPYYPWDGNQAEEEGWDLHRPESWKVHVCAVCGVRADKRCPQQGLHFCSQQHQKEYKKHGGAGPNAEQTNSKSELDLSNVLPSLLPLSELVVEEEPPPAAASANDAATNDCDSSRSHPLFPSNAKFGSSSDSEPDSDEDLEQEDLNEMVLGANEARNKTVNRDAMTQAFYDRVQRGDVQGQCLRYSRWVSNGINEDANNVDDDDAGVLWLHGRRRAVQVPRCEICGANRRFEFQLMPQLLHYLQKKVAGHKVGPSSATGPPDVEAVKNAMEQADSWIQQAPPELVPPALMEAKANAEKEMQKRLFSSLLTLDWGVVAVYTCTNSCRVGADSDADRPPELGAYVDEFAWRQSPLDDN
jgi:pre-rRNA-processing protein TSR4